MSNGKSELNGEHELALVLGRSTLFQENNPHVHIVPSTSNPAILGFMSFGFCCVLLMGVFAGWVEPGTKNIVISYSFTFAGLGQIITGLLESQRKNVFATNAFLTYGCFFLGFALQNLLYSLGVWKPANKGAQMAFILWGCVTFIFWVQTLVLNLALSALFFCVGILFMLVAAEQTHPSISHGTGIFGVITGLIAFYLATAIFFIENMGKEVLPLGHFHWQAFWTARRRRLGPVGTKRELASGQDATNV